MDDNTQGIVTAVERNSDGKRIVKIKLSNPASAFNASFEIFSGQLELDQPVTVTVAPAQVQRRATEGAAA